VADLFFTTGHEWIRFCDGEAVVGVSGVGLRGDVVYIELPEIGRYVKKGEVCALVETVKSVCDVHAPVTGVVISVNDTVFDDPDIIAKQPLETWLLKLRTADDDTQILMTATQYAVWAQTVETKPQ
jgi:glycine cleavage system H protein